MNNIIKPNGEYLKNEFTGDSGLWKLVGSECTGRNPLACLDTFRNAKTGVYSTKSRMDILTQAEQGKIK